MKTDNRDQILADVQAFCEEIRPSEELCYLEHRFNDQTLELGKKYKLLGLNIPEQYGGRGADAVTYTKAMVMVGREGSAVRTFFSAHSSIGAYPVLRYGSEQLKQKYLPKASSGECIMAFGLTEPDAGSNPLEMTSTYRKDGDRYLLNGVKYLISNGTIANAVAVFAYPQDATGADRRVSAFVVDCDGDTFEKEAIAAKMGMFTSDTGMFEMTDHPVPAENLLGEEGNGFRIAMGTLISGRLSVAAGCLGVIDDCLAEVLEYCKTREQHGKPIGKHQLVQEHIAMIEMHRATSEAMIDRAAEAKLSSDQNPGDAALTAEADYRIAQAKFHASNAAWDAADRAVQCFGGRGWSTLYRVGRHLQDVRVCRLYEGTDEVMKLKIAQKLLGKDFSAFK